jgi:hypothetical protein
MSYDTEIEFTFADEGPDFEAILVRARSYLEAQGREYAVDFILEQLRHALEEAVATTPASLRRSWSVSSKSSIEPL